MGCRILKLIIAAIFLPALLHAQPQGEIDPRSIWLNGTKTTTASIPFALGLSVPDNQYGYFGSSPGSITGVTNQRGYVSLVNFTTNLFGTWIESRQLTIATEDISVVSGDGTSSATAYNNAAPAIYITPGDSVVNATTGGTVRVEAGRATTGNAGGGDIFLNPGSGSGSGTGGRLSFTSGSGGSTSGNAGSLAFLGGTGYGSGAGAAIQFTAGAKGLAGTGNAGSINLAGGQNLQGGGGSAGSVILSGGEGNPSIANWGYVKIGSSGTPDKFSLNSSSAKSSLYVNQYLEVDSTTYLDGALYVVGTTTLATSLTGLALLTSGVVSATLTPSVTSILVGNGTAAAPSIAFASDTNTGIYRVAADALGVSAGGVLQTTTGTTGFTIANALSVGTTSDFTQATRVDYNYGYGLSGLNNSMPGGLIGDTGSNELMQFAINTTQAGNAFAVFGYAVDTGSQGGIFRFDTRNGYPIFSVTLQDWVNNLGGGSGIGYTPIQISSTDARMGLGIGWPGDSNSFGGAVDINPNRGDIGLIVRLEASSSANYISAYDASSIASWYIDKSSNIYTPGSVTASTAAFATAANNTAALKVGTTPTFQVNTTNSTFGYGAAPGSTIFETVTPPSGMVFGRLHTQTYGANTAGMYNLNFVDAWSWSGAAITAANAPNTIKATITDSHTATSGATDVSRFMTVAWTRSGTQDVSGPTTTTPQMMSLTLTDNGIYNKNNANTTVNPNAGMNMVGTFAPIYNDAGVGRTMTYNGFGNSLSMSFSPTITSGTVLPQLRGFYVTSLSGSTIPNISTSGYGAAFEAASVSGNYNSYGLKVTAVSGTTLATGVDVIGVTTATTTYGVRVQTSSGTTAYGIAIAKPTGTTNYALALDGTSTGSGIYFNTPTAAGTEYIRTESSGILQTGYGTTYRIKEPTTSTYPLQINSTGQVGICTNDSPQTYLKLYVQDKSTYPNSGLKYAFSAMQQVQPTGTWTGSNQGGFTGGVQYVATQDFNNGSTLIGLEGSAQVYVGAGKTIQSANSIFANSTARGNGGGGGTVTTFSLYGIYMTVDQATITTLYDYRTYDAPITNGGAVTTQYGYYGAVMTAATNNYEFWADQGGGYYARESTQKMYSSAASTLDLTANTTLNQRIGGTTKLALTSSTLTFSDAVNIAVNTSTGTKIGTGTTQKLGFWNATPIVQPSGTGETVGFTAGAGTAVKDDSTFTGNVGATAYRISDIVKALKNAGIMAQ